MESKNDILSFYDNCRICLKRHDQMTTINSLKENNELRSLLIYFNIEVIKDNRYPNKICNPCVQQLNNTLSFKQKCESSFNYLKEIFKESVNTDQKEDSKFCYLPIKDELQSNAYEDLDNLDTTSVKSEEDAQSINNVEKEKFDECITNNKKSENAEINKKVKETCQICNKSVSNLKRHQLIHKSDSEIEKIYKCQYCDQQFTSNLHCDRHKRETHSHELPFKCKLCPKTFCHNESLSRHKRIHSGKKQFVCQICSRAFNRRFHLKRHAETHNNEPKYFCHDCKIFFTLQQSLDKHTKQFHGDNPPPKTVCEECGKAVSNISSHMKRKHSVFQFECKYCKKTFPYKSVLDTHLTVHEREGALKSLCTLCGKAFRTNGELRIHNEINHSEECNYQCSYCERRFKTSSNCRKHEKTVHLNEQCYKCHLCPKAFTRKNSMVNHIRTHTGEKPFVCDICSRAFKQQTTLSTHRKLKHGRVLK